MTLQVIPSDLPTLTPGEKKVLEKLRALYKNQEQAAFLYVQPRIRNLEPDFILIDSKRGVSIVEVKDWSISYISSANRRKIQLQDGKEVDNPFFKANRYYNAAIGLFSMQDLLLGDDGDLLFPVCSRVIFPNMTADEISENELDTIFTQVPSTYISEDQIAKLSLKEFFSKDICLLENEELIAIRTLLFPEIKIMKVQVQSNKSVETEELIKALDAEQEKFAKRLPYGHYMVTGVPGSGKTVILLARAIYLLRQNPDWTIQILTYNRSLQTKIENSLNTLAADLTFMNVPLEKIHVATFHSFARQIAGAKVPQRASSKWWQETLPEMALLKVKPLYDAILIDEYQDFYDDWIRLCIGACVKHTFIDHKKEEREGINLFLAGDRLQSIYNEREQSWKNIGINMQGRSTLLKRSYRSGNEHIDLALNFLKQNAKLEDEVSKFYCSMDELTFENQITNGVSFLEGPYSSVNTVIRKLINEMGYKPEDILILCKDWKTCESVKSALDKQIQQKAEISKEIREGRLVITSYYSSKGLEAPVTFLIDVDKFTVQSLKQNDAQERKLLYVGMTRASQLLYIHAGNYKANSYASVLRESL